MLESLVISGPVTSMVDLRNDVGMMSTGNAINMQRSYYCKKKIPEIILFSGLVKIKIQLSSQYCLFGNSTYRWHGICEFDQMLLKKLRIATNYCTTMT